MRGHQDGDKAYSELDLNAQLNVEADGLANAFYNHPAANFEAPPEAVLRPPEAV